jgi:toxin YoeB
MPSAFCVRWVARGVAEAHRDRSRTLDGNWHLAAPADAGPPLKGRREAVFQKEFLEDLRFWVDTNRRVALRALDLVEAILRDPFQGLGKPEPLKYLGAGIWSRRLTEEHRVVYLVRHDRIDFLQARYHY